MATEVQTRAATAPDLLDKAHLGAEQSDLSDAELDDGELYELERMENIKANAAILAGLGLSSTPSIRPPKRPLPSSSVQRAKRNRPSASSSSSSSHPSKPKRLLNPAEPTRRSSRVRQQPPSASGGGLNYLGLPDSPPASPGARGDRNGGRNRTPPSVQYAGYDPVPKGRALVVPDAEDDAPLRGRAARPARGQDGRLMFEGRWKGVFEPNVTPEEMFRGGAFGGGFFTKTYSSILRSPLLPDDVIPTLPFAFSASDTDEKLANSDPDGAINRFGVRAGQSLQEWEKAGWIWAEDPRGWAEWYTRFWEGRRCEDDERQVKRWLKVAGSTGRFKRALLKKIQQHGGVASGAVEDETVSPILRQCLWQWGYELTRAEFDRAMRGDD